MRNIANTLFASCWGARKIEGIEKRRKKEDNLGAVQEDADTKLRKRDAKQDKGEKTF